MWWLVLQYWRSLTKSRGMEEKKGTGMGNPRETDGCGPKVRLGLVMVGGCGYQ
jgi:hypothetical protein